MKIIKNHRNQKKIMKHSKNQENPLKPSFSSLFAKLIDAVKIIIKEKIFKKCVSVLNISR